MKTGAVRHQKQEGHIALHTYIAVLEEGPSGGYGVSFPDLPGCVSAGDDLDDAFRMAGEALSLHLEGMIEDEEALPRPRSMTDLDHDLGRPSGVTYAVVPADIDDKGERVNVYLPKSLLTQIEQFGQRTGIDNRSTFFRLAARRYLLTESKGAGS